MTDDNVHTNLSAIYLQLTPWVQAFLAFTACVLVLGVAYFFKETVAALVQPFQRSTKSADAAAVSSSPPRGGNDYAVNTRILDYRQRLLEGIDA